jgi:hypothetical protein
VSTKSNTVAFAGAGLIAVNAWTGPQRQQISDALNGKANSSSGAHSAWVQIGAEAAFVLVATVAAGSSDSVGTGMIAALIALWVIWGINRYGGQKQKIA